MQGTLAWLSMFLGSVGVALGILARHHLGRFLDGTRSISSPSDLSLFRRMVHGQMWMTLVYLGLMMTMLGVALAGLVKTPDEVPSALAPFVVPVAMTLARAMMNVGAERRARNLKVTDAALEAEFERLKHMWRHKALPEAAP